MHRFQLTVLTKPIITIPKIHKYTFISIKYTFISIKKNYIIYRYISYICIYSQKELEKRVYGAKVFPFMEARCSWSSLILDFLSYLSISKKCHTSLFKYFLFTFLCSLVGLNLGA